MTGLFNTLIYNQQVEPDKVVTIEYQMRDSGGELVDSSDHSEPLSFIQGRATVFPAVEKQLQGCRTGDRRAFALEPREAYGERSDGLLRVVPRDRFDYEGELEVGMTFAMGRRPNQRPVTVIGIDGEQITVDANHPLAGERLDIDLIIVDVREAVESELATGIIQEMADIYAREQASGEREPGTYSVLVKGRTGVI